jgi:hypothetical protein
VLAVLMVATLVVAGCDRGSQTPEGGELAETPSPWPDDDATSAAVAPRGDMASPGPSTPSKAATPGGDADQAAGRKVPEAGEPPPLDGLYSDDELEVARTMARYTEWMSQHPNVDPDSWSNIIHPKANKDYDLLRNLTANYRDHDRWWVGGNSRVVKVDVLERKPRTRVVRIHYDRKEATKLLDPTGTVHKRKGPRQWWSEEVWHRSSTDDPWLVTSLGDSVDVEE